jgi:hypothetical protein
VPFFFAGCPHDILSTSLTSGRQHSWFERQNVSEELDDERRLRGRNLLVDGEWNAKENRLKAVLPRLSAANSSAISVMVIIIIFEI